jgi:hypothetical protein
MVPPPAPSFGGTNLVPPPALINDALSCTRVEWSSPAPSNHIEIGLQELEKRGHKRASKGKEREL